MPYVDKDGVLVQKSPYTIYGMFWSIVNFFYLLFSTLVNADYNKHGDKYTRTYSKPGGGGPPRPPSRKFGGFSSGSSPGPAPAGGGGCGCGG